MRITAKPSAKASSPTSPANASANKHKDKCPSSKEKQNPSPPPTKNPQSFNSSNNKFKNNTKKPTRPLLSNPDAAILVSGSTVSDKVKVSKPSPMEVYMRDSGDKASSMKRKAEETSV